MTNIQLGRADKIWSLRALGPNIETPATGFEPMRDFGRAYEIWSLRALARKNQTSATRFAAMRDLRPADLDCLEFGKLFQPFVSGHCPNLIFESVGLALIF